MVTLIVVAPYVGAWIETSGDATNDFTNTSHPTWVRGLKRETFVSLLRGGYVAPYVGAWIETGS